MILKSNKKEKYMLPENLEKTFTEFQNSVRNNNILDPKMTLLFHLAAAMAVGCYP